MNAYPVPSLARKEIIESAVEDGWDVRKIELCKEYLMSGNIEKGSSMFDAPKEVIIKWIRTKIVQLAINAKADYTKTECWKILLFDFRGNKAQEDIKVEVAIRSVDGSGAGVKIESGSQNPSP